MVDFFFTMLYIGGFLKTYRRCRKVQLGRFSSIVNAAAWPATVGVHIARRMDDPRDDML